MRLLLIGVGRNGLFVSLLKKRPDPFDSTKARRLAKSMCCAQPQLTVLYMGIKVILNA